MKYNPDLHHRKSIRLKDYDYSTPGAYFVTIFTKNRECLLGDIVNGKMELNNAGKIINDIWNQIPLINEGIYLDTYIIMFCPGWNWTNGLIKLVSQPIKKVPHEKPSKVLLS